jgi:hypothetical protein
MFRRAPEPQWAVLVGAIGFLALARGDWFGAVACGAFVGAQFLARRQSRMGLFALAAVAALAGLIASSVTGDWLGAGIFFVLGVFSAMEFLREWQGHEVVRSPARRGRRRPEKR